MNYVDIYIKCLILRYREKDKKVCSKDLVDKILNYYNIEENKVMGDENTKIENFKEFVKTYNQYTNKYTLKTLTEQVKLTLVGYPEHVKNIVDMLGDKTYTEEDVFNLRTELLMYSKKKDFEIMLRNTIKNIKAGKDIASEEILSQLKDIKNENKDSEEDVSVVDLEDESKVLEVAAKAEQLNNENLRLKTAIPKFNKALDGGFRKGEFVMIGALRFNYKSGILRTLFLQLAFSNTPKPKEETGKQPMLIYVGYEDPMEASLKFCYDYLYCNEFKKAPSKSIDKSEMTKYVISKLNTSPYKCVMIRADPNKLDLNKLISKIDEYIDKGYEVEAVLIDYLSKIAPKGPNGESNHDTIKQTYQDAYEEISKKRGILTITAHQLGSASRDLVFGANEPKDFVKNLPGRGATENCKSLDQIVDIEMYIHVYTDKLTKVSYLSCQIGKHRYSPTTPEQHKYFTIRFLEGGTLLENDDTMQDGLFNDDMLI